MLLASQNRAMSHACLTAAKRARKAGAAWVRIYGGPEVAGLLAAVSAFGLVHITGGPLLGSALLGSWAEDIAFVGYFAVRAVREEGRRHRHHHGLRYCLLTFGMAFSGLFIELGPAEVIDKFVRPALFYSVPASVPNLMAGFILAKVSADVVYYLLAYLGRTVRLRCFKPLLAHVAPTGEPCLPSTTSLPRRRGTPKASRRTRGYDRWAWRSRSKSSSTAPIPRWWRSSGRTRSVISCKGPRSRPRRGRTS